MYPTTALNRYIHKHNYLKQSYSTIRVSPSVRDSWIFSFLVAMQQVYFKINWFNIFSVTVWSRTRHPLPLPPCLRMLTIAHTLLSYRKRYEQVEQVKYPAKPFIAWGKSKNKFQKRSFSTFRVIPGPLI